MTQEKNSKLSAEVRRELVKPLIVKGMNSREIASELNVSPVTVRRDFQVLRNNFVETLGKEKIDNVLFEVNLSYAEIQKEIWKLILQTNDSKFKLKCLNSVSRILYEKVILMSKMGFSAKESNTSFEEMFVEAFNELQQENELKEKEKKQENKNKFNS